MDKKIEVMESIYDRNDKISENLNSEMTSKNIFVINLMGAPGVGKTSSLIQIIKRLNENVSVIEGDIESDIDTKKLESLGINTIQINTGGACHLDSPLIKDACEKLNLNNGFLFIENIGNLVCPAEFVIGEHVKVLVTSVTDGSDKPYKYPLAFEKADLILVNKCDLKEYVNFDDDYFYNGVRKLNSSVPIIDVSGTNGDGFDEVIHWLEEKKKEVLNK